VGFEPPTAEEARPLVARSDSDERVTLVTGGTGFVGSFLAKQLIESGRRVVVYDIKDFAPEGRFVLGSLLDDVTVERGSIDDQARFSDVVRRHAPSEIVHMAMIIDPAFLARDRSTGFRVDVVGTQIVLEAMKLFDVERLVYFSSIGALAPKQYEPVDAAHPVILPAAGPGTGFYGAYKVAGETMCFAYNQAFGVDFATIRPSAVYGLGMNDFPGPIKAMVEGAVRGEKVRFETGGKHPRAYTHAIDVAGVTMAALERPDDADRIFYGSTGEPLDMTTRVAEIVNELIDGADVEIGEELSPAEIPVVALRAQLSIENARSQLGWEPRFASLEEGIAQYAEQYRAFLEWSGSS
jgi:nucleoside-diphosphate-sugar epimerase